MSDAPPSRWAELQSFCAAVREMMVILAIVLLMLAPGSVRSLLERAGIRSVAGVEFDATTLAEAQSELSDAQKQLQEMRSQLAMAQTVVDSATTNAGATDPVGGSGFAAAGSARLPSLSGIAAEAPHPSLMSVSRLLNEMKQKAEQTEDTLARSSQLQNRILTRPSDHKPIQLKPLEELLRRDDEQANVPSSNSVR